MESWNMIIQYRQEYPEERVLLSNRKWSDSLNSSALSYFVEKGWECYRLLHTPQCDKPCCLHIGRAYTTEIFFTQWTRKLSPLLFSPLNPIVNESCKNCFVGSFCKYCLFKYDAYLFFIIQINILFKQNLN